jgi:photosystem II stability/assembly factor-like uncharacterized protein
MKKLIVLFSFLAVHSISYSQWVQVNSGTSSFLQSIQIIGINTGYAAGFNGTVLRTTDGGLTWSSRTSPSSGNINKIFFAPVGSGTTGWAGGTGLFKSTNGGGNWEQQSASVIADMYFADANTGAVLTSELAFGKTSNGGSNFTLTNITSRTDLAGKSLRFAVISYALGVNAAGDSSFIFKSTNTGDTWAQVFKINGFYSSFSFVNNNTGIMCGSSGLIRKTTDGGSSWPIINSGTSVNLQKAAYISSSIAYITGLNGVILKSTDAGATWLQQQSGTGQVLKDVLGFENDLALICGGNGTILRTTNGGLTAINQQSNEIADSYSLSQNYPNPFNPSTKIRFSLPVHGFTKVTVYNSLGKEAAVIVNEALNAGSYQVNWNAAGFTSGVYYYRIVSGNFSDTKKMLLLK